MKSKVTTLALFLSILIGSLSYGLHTANSKGLTDQDPVSAIASNIFHSSEFIVVGEYISVTDTQFDEPLFNNRKISSVFSIDESFKCSKNLSQILVDLNSDMLIYPGEGISRYEKRNQILMDARQQREIGSLDQATSEMMGQLKLRAVASIDFDSFYDIDGSIKPRSKYLLFFEKKCEESDTYWLNDAPANIYWGENLTSIVVVLKQLQKNEND